MEEKNPAALEEMKNKLMEAIDRQLWTPRSNSARFDLMTNDQGRELSV
jgi:cobaltochelatase CobN